MALAAKRATGGVSNDLPQIRTMALLAGLGLSIRFALLFTPFHGYDSFIYGHWSWRITHEPLGQFYVDDGQGCGDHDFRLAHGKYHP